MCWRNFSLLRVEIRQWVLNYSTINTYDIVSFSFQRSIFLEAEYEEVAFFVEERRERLPALYKKRRLFKKLFPDLTPTAAIEAENHIRSNFTN